MITPNMKALKLLAIPLMLAILVSCDDTPEKVKTFTYQFIKAAMEKDMVTVYDMYPDSKNYSCLELVEQIWPHIVYVKFNKVDSVYEVEVNEIHSLIIKPIEKDSFKITDSYGVFKLDTASCVLAAKTGVPTSKNSDMKNGRLFIEDGGFIEYLLSRNPDVKHGNLERIEGWYSWHSNNYKDYVEITTSIRNNGSVNVRGGDYRILYTFISDGEIVYRKTIDGVDISAGEIRANEIDQDNLYHYAQKKDLGWVISFNFKDASDLSMLAKYGSFTGKEYDEFLKKE